MKLYEVHCIKEINCTLTIYAEDTEDAKYAVAKLVSHDLVDYRIKAEVCKTKILEVNEVKP